MITIIIALVFNLICYGAAYFMMPQLTAIEFLGISILLPVVFNVVLFLKGKQIRNNKLLTMSALAGITTICYIAWGIATTLNGSMHEFALRNSFSDGNIKISISENSNSVANIVYMILIQLSVLIFVKYIQERSLKYDTGK